MSEQQKENDYARKSLPFMIGWGLPMIVLVSVNFLEEFLPAAPIILMMAGSYAWMGAGCVINAIRCGRLHCHISGPAMLIGAALILLVGFNIIDLGPIRVMHISYATITLVLFSFVLEWILGGYVKRSSN